MNRAMIDVKGLGKDYQIRVQEGNVVAPLSA